MNTDEIDTLIKRIPEIAEAVNSFKSEELQRQAFDLLVSQMGVVQPVASTSSHSTKEYTHQNQPKNEKIVETTKTKSRPKAKKTYSIDKNLNLRPDGKASFRDFTTEKSPSNHLDKVTIAVYYLKEILALENATVSHVLTCYQDASWRLPSNPINTVQQAGSKGYVDSSNAEDITLTPAGQNLVKFDLPRAKS